MRPADPSTDLTATTNDALRGLRELRKCLDGVGAKTVPATVRLHGGAAPEVELLVAGVESIPCIMQARAMLMQIAGATPGVAQCTYECANPNAPPVLAPLPPAVAPTLAAAPPPPVVPPEPEAPSGDRWYGWQTIIADAASAAVLAGGLLAWKVEPTAVGYGGFLLGTPILHAVHGNVGRLFASFAMRVLIPTLAGGIGAGVNLLATKGDPTKKGIVEAAGIGAAIGAGGCILIDFGAMSWEKRESRSGKAASVGGAF